MFRYQSLFSVVGGALIGWGIVTCIFSIGWWTLLILPLFFVAFFLVLFLPYYIDDWLSFREYRKRVRK